MVDVAQLVEPRIVIPAVAGSNPVVHPNLAFHGPRARRREGQRQRALRCERTSRAARSDRMRQLDIF